jgi:glycosyltransferase involved in cell wall biosynthesis
MIQEKRILNFSRVAQGGGVQNSLSFIENLKFVDEISKYVIVARKESEVSKKAIYEGYDVILVQKNEMDFFSRNKFSKGQICFTFFGPPWVSSIGYLVNVCGVAYSNLFYPEIDFWSYYGGVQKIKRNFKDFCRYSNVRFSDFWIFETESLAERAKKLAGFPDDRVGVVRMSPSTLVAPERIRESWVSEFESMLTPGSFRMLFLASDNPNKRIVNVAKIVNKILENSDLDMPIEVITTLNEDSEYFKEIYKEFKKLQIEDRLINIGPVSFEKVPSLISASSCMCLFSVLESFSNNMVEAWRMGVPFVVTDSDWARSEAGNAAIYVDPEDVDASSNKILGLLADPLLYEQFILNGYKQLEKFPDSMEKTKKYLHFMEAAEQKGFIGGERRGIKFFVR